MGMYNLLIIDKLTCPHCDLLADPQVEMKCGALSLTEYHMGEIIKWAERKRKGYPSYIQQTRPKNGDHIEYGYAECLHCQKDFWVKIKIYQDVISEFNIVKKEGAIHPHLRRF